jgi:membrane protease YdiL (CAAX protease family)
MPERVGAKEALLAGACLLALLTVVKHLGAVSGRLESAGAALAVAFQLYVPLWLIQRRGELPESHGIHVHGLILGPVAAWRQKRVLARRQLAPKDRPPRSALLRSLAHYGHRAHFRAQDLKADLKRALLLCAVLFPPFAVGHHFFQMTLAEVQGRSLQFQWGLPEALAMVVLQNLLVVALPEELFYRGFMQTRLLRLWPRQKFILGIPLGRAVVVTALIFALGHFLGEYNPLRLGPFFPAFVFSALVLKSRSIFGAMIFHALSNVFSALLQALYHYGPAGG